MLQQLNAGAYHEQGTFFSFVFVWAALLSQVGLFVQSSLERDAGQSLGPRELLETAWTGGLGRFMTEEMQVIQHLPSIFEHPSRLGHVCF